MKFKGVLHMHSTHSYDGKLTLRELKTFLVSKGISFACMSEHTDTLDAESAGSFVSECNALSDERFVFVPGFEVPYKDAHVLMFGCETFVTAVADRASLIEWSQQAGFIILAHPVRNRFKIDETLTSVIEGVEVWNEQYEGKSVPRPHSLGLLSDLRAMNILLLATGGLDFHRREHYGSPLTELDIESLSKENIMTALRKGAYTFGNEDVRVPAHGQFAMSARMKLASAAAVLFIGSGKRVNALLAYLGLSFPRWLKSSIRSRV